MADRIPCPFAMSDGLGGKQEEARAVALVSHCLPLTKGLWMPTPRSFEILAQFALTQMAPTHRTIFMKLAETFVSDLEDSFLNVAAAAAQQTVKVERLTEQVRGYDHLFLAIKDACFEHNLEVLTPVLLRWAHFTEEHKAPLPTIDETRSELTENADHRLGTK